MLLAFWAAVSLYIWTVSNVMPFTNPSTLIEAITAATLLMAHPVTILLVILLSTLVSIKKLRDTKLGLEHKEIRKFTLGYLLRVAGIIILIMIGVGLLLYFLIWVSVQLNP